MYSVAKAARQYAILCRPKSASTFSDQRARVVHERRGQLVRYLSKSRLRRDPNRTRVGPAVPAGLLAPARGEAPARPFELVRRDRRRRQSLRIPPAFL